MESNSSRPEQTRQQSHNSSYALHEAEWDRQPLPHDIVTYAHIPEVPSFYDYPQTLAFPVSSQRTYQDAYTTEAAQTPEFSGRVDYLALQLQHHPVSTPPPSSYTGYPPETIPENFRDSTYSVPIPVLLDIQTELTISQDDQGSQIPIYTPKPQSPVLPRYLESFVEVPSPPIVVGVRKKEKKAKMHSCEVCRKQFPRPSGLRTHMNTHNNVKPYSCSYTGCNRSFTVRSNAKRHLRTHGVDPNKWVKPQKSDIEAPAKPEWIPSSLATRSNVNNLHSVGDDGRAVDYDSDSDDQWKFDLPLKHVTSTPLLHEGDVGYEERDSYREAPLYPYHPSQFQGLPGPIPGPRSTAVV